MPSNPHARPKVAVVYHFFPHYREAVNRALHEEGSCEWTFCGDLADFTDSRIKPAAFEPGMRFRRLRNRRIRGSVIWQQGVLSIAASREFDTLVLLGVPKYLSMWPAALIGRLTGKRVLFWTHGWTYRPTGPLRYVRRWFFRMGNALMTYGRWAKALAIEEGFDPSTVHVIGNSLDLAEQERALRGMHPGRPAELRTSLFGDAETPVIICTTRLVASRRLDLLFDAAHRLRASGLSVNLVLVGDGPERARLESMAEGLGLRVAFTGAIYDEVRIGELMRASNVAVLPGNVGLSAMHAMAFGIPVVSHDDPERQGPEFESIVPGKTGELFRIGDVESLAAAIRPWLRNPWVDPGVAASCQSIVRRFWSPEFQVRAIVRAVKGSAADDLFFLRESPVAPKSVDPDPDR